MPAAELAPPTADAPTGAPHTLADLVERLGGIPLERIWCDPPPGTATEDDVLRLKHRGGGKHLLELVDGVLVEKAVGYHESILAAAMIQCLRNFVTEGRLGWVAGADGPHRLAVGLVRYPDVGFVLRDRFPDGLPEDAIARFAPDLAVEVLSRGNTAGEMRLKREAFFAAGVREVWIADPRAHTVRVYRSPESPEEFDELGEADTLDGGDLLPGFRLGVAEWFAATE